MRGIIKFDLSTLTTITITSAKLYLYATSVQQTTSCDVYCCKSTKQWTESTCTWNSNYYYYSYIDYVTYVRSGSANVWHEWDITALAQGWMNSPLTNYGVIIINESNCAPVPTQTYASSEYSDTSLRPKLVITYSGSLPEYSIMGYMYDTLGAGAQGITINLSGAETASTTTDSGGFYQFLNLTTGNYTVIPAGTNLIFNPASLSYSPLNEDQNNQNFTCTEAPYGIINTGSVKIVGGEHGYVDPTNDEKAAIVLNPVLSDTITIKIYTLNGQLVWETTKDATANVQDNVYWECVTQNNDMVASGIYMIHVKGGGIDQVKKVAVIK